jgi:hypothetical protein
MSEYELYLIIDYERPAFQAILILNFYGWRSSDYTGTVQLMHHRTPIN